MMVSVCTVFMISACGFTVEQHEEIDGGTSGESQGTMPAGEEAPEQVGVLKSVVSSDEVILTVDGQEGTYRLSADAKAQLENEEVKKGDEVTFTTYSIGDDQETIDTFIME